MPSRIQYKGVSLFINDESIERATSFGTTTNLTTEDILELGNAGVVEVVDDVPQVEGTLDSNDYGSLKTLALLAGKPANSTSVELLDFEFAKADIYVPVKVDGSIVRTMYIENMFANSIGLNYSVDGNFTESYGLQSDNKVWFLNQGSNISKVSAAGPETPGNTATVTASGATNIHKVLACWVTKAGVTTRYTPVTGAPSDETEVGWAATGNEVTLTFHSSVSVSSTDTVSIRVAADGGGSWLTLNTTAPGALRLGQIEIYLLTDVVKDADGALQSANAVKQLRLQSVGIDASLDREELKELGSTRAYDRPLNFPVPVNVNLDVVDSDLALFARLTGLAMDTSDAMSISDLKKDRGVMVKLYKEKDTYSGARTLLKVVTVTDLVPTSEAWNASTTANAAQTFAFRSSNLKVSTTVPAGITEV